MPAARKPASRKPAAQEEPAGVPDLIGDAGRLQKGREILAGLQLQIEGVLAEMDVEERGEHDLIPQSGGKTYGALLEELRAKEERVYARYADVAGGIQ